MTVPFWPNENVNVVTVNKNVKMILPAASIAANLILVLVLFCPGDQTVICYIVFIDPFSHTVYVYPLIGNKAMILFFFIRFVVSNLKHKIFCSVCVYCLVKKP